MIVFCLAFLILLCSSFLNAQEFEETILRSPDPGQNDFFGSRMLFFDDLLIVSAIGDNTGGEDRGSVYVFAQDDDATWFLQQKLQASDAVNNSWFGSGLAMDGSTLVIGAFLGMTGNSQTGSAYIFKRIDESWEEVEKLYPLDGRPGDEFGRSVAVYGDYIVVGAPAHSQDNGLMGAAYIYNQPDDSTEWMEVAKLTASDGEELDLFGRSVDIYEDRLIVTAVGDDGVTLDGGSAYIFEHMGDVWQETAKLTGSGVTDNQWFGASVILEEDYAIIGSSGNISNSNPGQVYVFRYDSLAGIWNEEQILMDLEDDGNNFFGFSIARYADYLMVGAIFSVYNGTRSGAAHLFVLKENSWSKSFTFLPEDGQNGDFFGSAVAMNGSQYFIGAEQAYEPSQYTGAVYIYNETSSGLVDETKTHSPNRFVLLQNYPNPFNPSTNFKFFIPKDDFVNLRVYDLNGRELVKLVEEYRSAGEHSVLFDASNLAAGTYFYTLTSGKLSETRKFTLVK